MFVDIFSFCTPYVWEIFANDVPAVFEFFKKEKKEKRKSFFLSYGKYMHAFTHFLCCSLHVCEFDYKAFSEALPIS